jgi:hypothetical protein
MCGRSVAKKRVVDGREGFRGVAGIDIPLASPWLVSPLYRPFSQCSVNGKQQKRRTMGDIDADRKAREELYR